MDTSYYYELLKRVPDDVMLAVATRDLDVDMPPRCVCGWVLREAVARLVGKDAGQVRIVTAVKKALPEYKSSGVDDAFVPDACARLYGGEVDAWEGLFWNITGADHYAIESAFVQRVAEAAQAQPTQMGNPVI